MTNAIRFRLKTVDNENIVALSSNRRHLERYGECFYLCDRLIAFHGKTSGLKSNLHNRFVLGEYKSMDIMYRFFRGHVLSNTYQIKVNRRSVIGSHHPRPRRTPERKTL